jgi:caffeoyl-CoA O-methyltransferase
MTVISEPGVPRPVTPSSILARQLAELLQQAEEMTGLDPAWCTGLRQACELAGGLDPYLDRWSTPESSELALLAARTRAEDWRQQRHSGTVSLEQEMLSGHVEGQLLKMLVHATRARRVLDIGMFTGYSALAMAEALPRHGEVIACEIDPGVAGLARGYFDETAHGHQIDIRIGPATCTLQVLAAGGEMFDLIFIDADKAGYWAYLDEILDADLLAPHGLICVDNTLMQGQPWSSTRSTDNGRAIAEFNARVAADHRVEQVIIPLRDGLTLIRQVDGGQ